MLQLFTKSLCVHFIGCIYTQDEISSRRNTFPSISINTGKRIRLNFRLNIELIFRLFFCLFFLTIHSDLNLYCRSNRLSKIPSEFSVLAFTQSNVSSKTTFFRVDENFVFCINPAILYIWEVPYTFTFQFLKRYARLYRVYIGEKALHLVANVQGGRKRSKYPY